MCFSDSNLTEGEKVIVKGDFGNELGTILASDVQTAENPAQPVLRKATGRDLEVFEKNRERREEIGKAVREEVKKLDLVMKLADVLVSLDGGNITVVFSAEERVDFRELVKSLTKILRRSVRMHQIGSRDEARRWEGCGICGRELCCRRFLKNLPSISIETARIQQIAHRGSERISGQCGRLLCCLAYEAEQYQELMKDMPEISSTVKTKEGKGEVIEINALTQELKIKLEDGKIISLKKDDI